MTADPDSRVPFGEPGARLLVLPQLAGQSAGQ
jgi:hypothetical protein